MIEIMVAQLESRDERISILKETLSEVKEKYETKN